LYPTTFDHMWEMFRPVYKKLNSAGATVVLEYPYAYKGRDQNLHFDLTEFFSLTPRAWRMSVWNRIQDNSAANALWST